MAVHHSLKLGRFVEDESNAEKYLPHGGNNEVSIKQKCRHLQFPTIFPCNRICSDMALTLIYTLGPRYSQTPSQHSDGTVPSLHFITNSIRVVELLGLKQQHSLKFLLDFLVFFCSEIKRKKENGLI